MAHEIMEMTGIDTRGTCLGHIQRGGSPTVRDRIAATRMGYHAVQILKKGIGNRVVGEKTRHRLRYGYPGGAGDEEIAAGRPARYLA